MSEELRPARESVTDTVNAILSKADMPPYVPFPHAFHTVDIAAYRVDPFMGAQILMGRKADETKWRLPGGFVDPTDESAEHAAARELFEETQLKAPVFAFRYVGSFNIDDGRYRNTVHGIITSVFLVQLHPAAEAVAGDDLAEVRWVPVSQIDIQNMGNFTECHVELIRAAVNRIYVR